MIIKNLDRENFRNADGINPFVSNFDPKKLKKSFLRDFENFKKKNKDPIPMMDIVTYTAKEKDFNDWFARMIDKHKIPFYDRVDCKRYFETLICIEVKIG